MGTASGKGFGREIKIGVTLIGILLVTFSALLVRRMIAGGVAPGGDMAFAPGADGPAGATLMESASLANMAGDPTMPGPAAMDAPPGGVDDGDPSRRPSARRGPISAAAYEQTDGQAPETARRRSPFMLAQDGGAGQPPTSQDAAIYDPPIADAAPFAAGAAPMAMMANDPNGAPSAAPVDAVSPDATQSYAAPTDPGAGVPLQPIANDAVAADASAPGNSPVPFSNAAPYAGPDPYNNSDVADNTASGNIAASGDNMAPPQFVAQGAVRTAGHELRDADGRSTDHNRFFSNGAPGNNPGGATSAMQSAAPPGAYSDPGYGNSNPNGGGAYDPPAASGEPGKYVVQPNDNYWTICEKVYGAGAYFKALQKFNSDGNSNASRLQVGDVLAVPPTAVLRQRFADLCPKPRRERAASQMQPVSAGPRQRQGATVYVVEQGDSLFDIARHQLGKASRWVEIYNLNRDTLGDDFHYLRPGTELVMPGAAPPTEDAITRQRDDSIRR